MTITLEQAKNLTRGTIIYHNTYRNADGTPERWKINGKVKTWKTRPNHVQVPLKHGLRDFDYLTHENLHKFSLTEEDAYAEHPEVAALSKDVSEFLEQERLDSVWGDVIDSLFED